VLLALEQFHLVKLFVFRFLFPNILSDMALAFPSAMG
jgi:hypothetical protein